MSVFRQGSAPKISFEEITTLPWYFSGKRREYLSYTIPTIPTQSFKNPSEVE